MEDGVIMWTFFLDFETQTFHWHKDFWKIFWFSIFYFVLFCTIVSVMNCKHTTGKDFSITCVDIVNMYHNPITGLSESMTQL